MSAPITTFKTNAKECSVHEVVLGCDKLWAMGQEEAIRRLSKKRSSASSKYELISDFGARAARIAAAYASFYLEQGEDGKPELKGRFYWMGLAAFASKQVKCGLDFIPSEPYLTLTPLAFQPPLRIGKNELGKGNFWLFQDIFVWHWFYSKYKDQFNECAPERNARSCEGQIKTNIDSLPWANDALSTLGNLHVTDEIKSGFKSIQNTESLSKGTARREMQLSSLMDIANHEQRKILQPLIYDGKAFQTTLKMQAGFEWAPFVPVRVAAFSTACDVEQPELRVQMKKGDLYDETDRMVFITEIANQYHFLMGKKAEYMEGEIKIISTWSNQQ
ncbi:MULTISPECIES: DUF2515 family protein [Pseudomonas]|jgi:hypothetical protein|uniref:Uncharacterized protein n=1 Tax=Pseudomonas fluorescens TaxID=294 RepID=A0A5E7GX09_PSEFL|nr:MULTISPECIES: hypothetical protein [Pseudomonas]MBU0522555.1 hypothetical protein [Gammaproteobacteria bacterium]MBU0822026.1 hypothetical protein [Gammaproteobacteria bacterium]MBU0844139.1 hypothetical protein [Gammaproteobacteria bacterium]MBU1842390.1 hypothetical protein [Gammaproteobacteria bacterium]PMV89605.1 hypothetical protein C1X56_04060 [Pseudomonas sp. GW101-1A09]